MIAAFGLSHTEISRAVSPLVHESEHEETLATFFARGVWSRLTEPGDSIAGWLLNTAGAKRALEFLIAGLSVAQVRADVDTQDAPTPSEAQLHEALSRWRARLNLTASLSDFSAAQRSQVQLVTPEMLSWPRMLGDLGAHAPLSLWTRGDTQLLCQASAAVVGSRAATGYGELVTAEISRGLATAGIVITSGGAFGIDAIAHRAAIAAQGSTIAVFAGGIDRLYPSAHERLFGDILERGLICAELPPGSAPTKWRFLQRNRIIAALTNVTVVCEAGHRSGSLNTAGHAAQLSRPIGAVPGPVTSSASAGCHRLLREYDAVCIRNSHDVLELLSPTMAEASGPGESQRRNTSEQLSQPEIRVLDALSKKTPRSIETLAKGVGLSHVETADALADLHLQGKALQRSAGWVKSLT